MIENSGLTRLMDQRVRLAVLPTPLHRLDRLSAMLDRDIWIKRDDLTGLAMGGNKVRKMELIAADAQRQGCDTLLTVGAAQSNHARTVAAVASTLGMDCDLVISGSRPARVSGNLALDVIFGARLHFAGTSAWADLQEAQERLAETRRAEGRRPYVIPVGGSTPLGVAAFAAAYLELAEQCRRIGLRPATIVHASSSGGTQAGLELGRQLAGDTDTRVVGIDVAKISDPLTDQVAALWAAGAELLGTPAPDRRPMVSTAQLGPGYAVPSAESTAALAQLARVEGIVADPVYTAKALAALCTDPGADPSGSSLVSWPVVFWHTGGVPATLSDAGLASYLEEQQCAGTES